jgi:hypothetical protein
MVVQCASNAKSLNSVEFFKILLKFFISDRGYRQKVRLCVMTIG